MEQNTSFGAWLEEKRGDMPMRIFAEQVGVDIGTLSRTERDCTGVLVSTSVRICRGLDMSLSDFFQDWQGRNLQDTGQLDQRQWQGVLTKQEVQQWILRLLEGHRRNRELLIAVLNLIVLRSGLLSSPLPQLSQLFSLADIEKMLWDLPWFRFEVAPPLSHEPIIANLKTIYQHGGLVLPAELGAYAALQRNQRGLSLKQCSEAIHMPLGTLSSIENGMVKHLKLCDLVLLDDFLQQRGDLLALYWWEVSNRQALEQEWNELQLTAPYTPRVKHMLASLFISVGRWLQYIYQSDTIWLSTIRHELGLAKTVIVAGSTCSKE
jgi:transcriptional regulator with XRE-family HTH domain